ncbi:Uncharacterised protein [Streptococcus pneumoniae]|nr:Uncharacterised protein [Streptococcus pneumoniae]
MQLIFHPLGSSIVGVKGKISPCRGHHIILRKLYAKGFIKVYLYKCRVSLPISENNILVNILENIDFLVPNSLSVHQTP